MRPRPHPAARPRGWRVVALLAIGPMLALTGASGPAAAQAVDPEAPRHVHLGLPGPDAATSRSLVWTQAVASQDPSVRLAFEDGTTVEVPAGLVDGPLAWAVVEAHLPTLAPGSRVTYHIHDRAFLLDLPPAEPDAARPLRLVALGDMGLRPAAAAAVRAIEALAPDLVLHAGDVSYAEGDAGAWAAWFDLVEPVASRIPWVTALGNHETYTGSPELTGRITEAWRQVTGQYPEVASYRRHFSLPGNELWYSFDLPALHVVVLDTFSHPDAPGAEQLAWLERDLASRPPGAWTVVLLHEPLYSSNAHRSSLALREALAPRFEAHGVDLVVQAHDHGYERTHPVRAGTAWAAAGNGTVVPRGAGVVYLVTGGGGAPLYHGWEQPAPPWSAARASVHHVTLLEVTPQRLAWRVVATDASGFEDAFALTQGAAPPPVPVATASALPPAAGSGLVLALVAVLALVLGTRRTC